MIDIAIIHSQPIYRQGLSLLLKGGIEDLNVIASAGNLREFLGQFKGKSIDVIIWDIPGHHALTPGAKILKECYPLSRLLVLVSSSNSVYAGLLETLGANAVLPADCHETELYQAILNIHRSYAPPPLSNHVQEPMAKSTTHRLKGIELTVLKLISQGRSCQEIAQQLNLSEHSIFKCQTTLKKKFEVETTSSLVQAGIEQQIINQKTT